MNKNKAALAEVVHEHVGGSKASAERAVDAIIETITNTLKEGGEVSIAGLGIFSAKMRAARTARNPKTGEPVQVPAMRVPKFRAAKGLKDSVRGNE
jgi:DNA-binding protein HU-beta